MNQTSHVFVGIFHTEGALRQTCKDMITIAKKLSFFFAFFFSLLMFGKHLGLCDCYPKAHSYNNNSKLIKTKKDSQDEEDVGK